MGALPFEAYGIAVASVSATILMFQQKTGLGQKISEATFADPRLQPQGDNRPIIDYQMM
jgi:hypothetical protein